MARWLAKWRPISLLFGFAIPAIALTAASTWWPDSMLPRTRSASIYDTVEVSRGPIAKLVTTSGPVRALVTVSIGSQLSGQVAALSADFNRDVKAGDVLAEIDDKTFRSRVRQAEADIKAARAAVVTQQAGRRRVQAIQEQAARALTRQKALAARGITAQISLDGAERDLAVAEADIAVADAQIAAAEAQVAQREAALRQAEIDLDRTRIRAPIDGTVISRTIDVGQTVAASLQAPELFKIAGDLRKIRIEAQVNEADVGSVADGQRAEFTVDAFPERTFEGRVSQVRLAAVELQNVVTYTVIIEAENPDRRLYPGMTANVRIETARRDGVLRVANDALRFRPKGAAAQSARAGDRNAGAGAGTGGGASRGQAAQRMLETLTEELTLTDAQMQAASAAAREAFEALRAERAASASQQRPSFGGAQPTPSDDMRGARGQIFARLEAALLPLLSEDQKPLFQRWKKGREATRRTTLYVIGANGEPEARMVRLGIADDQFTEVLGRGLAEGERLITRAREARK